VEAYKHDLQEYHDTLDALERGENPRGLRDAYERAIQQAERKFGSPEATIPTPEVQKETIIPSVKTASKEMTEQLENALLDTLFEGVNPGDTPQEEQIALREEFREHIRETEVYRKMILSGDDNISKVLSDPQKLTGVYTNVITGLAEKMTQKANVSVANEPQKHMEKERQSISVPSQS
jgi:hypothetical protein